MDEYTRIIKGTGSWWCLAGSRIARLPAAVVTRTVEGKFQLTTSAAEQLRDAGFFASNRRRKYGLTVLTSTACNLGCSYCFQNVHATGKLPYAPDRIPKAELTNSIVDEIMNFTAQNMRESGLDQLKILLFGGEPLLNYHACKRLLTKGADIGLVSASMISNGVLLSETIAKELAALGLDLVQITFDGDEAVHDSIRVTRNGRSTYRTIVDNVVAASNRTNIHWMFRINISHRNEDSVIDLLEDLALQIEPTRVTINLALVNDVGIGYENSIRYTDELADRFISWWLHALELGFNIRTPQARFFCDYCSVKAGELGAVVNADGTLFSSWETAGRDDMAVGHVRTGYISEPILSRRWHACNYKAAPRGDGVTTNRFNDKVDAAILDALHSRGVLR